ncbi:hypothetical protein RHECIAT_CH0003847 [Rhizobium etli CIAT 652]|uniref:Uncharacterized protein n=1 Tax=Rhizobium etli (strain CIAT 652) TaxID=491916 RepID=B3PZY4_RHIE6|nr:hypothetical protein RHECIAT_CH0003847 [Rhizobium etli CIAT 652]
MLRDGRPHLQLVNRRTRVKHNVRYPQFNPHRFPWPCICRARRRKCGQRRCRSRPPAARPRPQGTRHRPGLFRSGQPLKSSRHA